MKRINELNISIDRAEVTSISIGLVDREWQMTISGNLISSTGQEVTSFNYSTNTWSEKTKIEFPSSAMGLGAKLFEIAQPIIIKKIQGHFRALGAGETNNEN